MPELVRTVRFRPYVKDGGPSFTLRLYDLGRGNHVGQRVIGYELKVGRRTLFKNTDPEGAIYDYVDAGDDRAVRVAMHWLTLRPGETDSEYFEKYTPEQLAFANTHAENLSAEVAFRFGED